MIRWVIFGGALTSGFAFGLGCFVGWKTTLRVVDSLGSKHGTSNNAS